MRVNEMKRYTTGLSNLDKLIGGGLPEHTVTLLSGNAGTGKTLFALNFLLAGAKKGEKGVFVSLNEGKGDLLRACDGIAQLKPIRKYLNKSILIQEIDLEEVIDLEYFTKIFEKYSNVDRVAIDNVNKLLLFSNGDKDYRINLSRVIKNLRANVGSSLLLCETLDHTLDTNRGETYEADGVINLSFLEVEEKPSRTLEITKMRYTPFDAYVQHELSISKKGLKLTKAKFI